jgi:hypothetical protein
MEAAAIPPVAIDGARRLGVVRLFDAAFEPCFDLVVDDVIHATVFYDSKPEAAFAEVEVEDDNGEIRMVPGAEAGLDEEEVGWCLQFTDQPRMVTVMVRAPASWDEIVLGAAWVRVADRIDEQGRWEPAPDFRLWREAEEEL